MPIPFLFVLYQFIKRLWGVVKDPEFRGMLIFVVLVLLAGALFYHKVEGWGWLDALYFAVITLTTIGYGDFTPRTPAGKLFTIFYILLGMGVLAVFITTLAQNAMQEQRQKAKEKQTILQPAEGDSQTTQGEYLEEE